MREVVTFRRTQPQPHGLEADVTERFRRGSVPTGIDALLHVCDPDEHKTNSLIHANDFPGNHLGVDEEKGEGN